MSLFILIDPKLHANFQKKTNEQSLRYLKTDYWQKNGPGTNRWTTNRRIDQEWIRAITKEPVAYTKGAKFVLFRWTKVAKFWGCVHISSLRTRHSLLFVKSLVDWSFLGLCPYFIFNPIPTGGGSKWPTALHIYIQNPNCIYLTVETLWVFLSFR